MIHTRNTTLSELHSSPLIAILLPNLHGGGVERMRIHLTHYFISRGYRVDFVLMRAEGELLQQVPDGVRVVELKASRIRSVIVPLVRYLRLRRPDSFLAGMWPLTVVAIVAHWLSRQRGRLVVSDHVAFSMSPQASGFVKRLLLRWSVLCTYSHADACIAVSSGVAEDLSDISSLPIERFSVVYNPAAKGLGPVIPVQESQKAKPYKLILSVGTLKRQKDHKSLIRAFAKMKTQKETKLVILGEGELRAELESLIREMKMEKRISLPGFAVDTRAYYAAADLFVLSSRWEGFGNVIVEALENGVPVVSTDCRSGPNEILQNGTYGSLVPVGDVCALADAMDDALEADHDPVKLRQRASDFSIDRIAEQYLELMFPLKPTKMALG